jgi:hypothetical protein
MNIKIGDKFGKLMVSSFTESSHKRKQFNCICDCGNTKILSSHALVSDKIKSCGCLHNRRGKNNPLFRGCGEFHQKMFLRIKKQALSRNLSFDVTIEDLWNLYVNQNRFCALTNLPIKFPSKSGGVDGNASLDRIDNDKGYTLDNLQWVHKSVNKMKSVFHQNEFIKYCKLVTEKHSQKGTE